MVILQFCLRLLAFNQTLTKASIVSIVAVMAMPGCSTPSAIPESYDLPTILDLQIPLAQKAILNYADEHDGQLPDTSLGEQLAIRAVKLRTRTTDELNATGENITINEFIDGGAYIYRSALDTFILASAGRVVQTKDGNIQSNLWFVYQGRYSHKGKIIDDKTWYLENADLFLDAMRSSGGQSRNDWNYSAWAIRQIYFAVSKANGKAAADALVDQFVKDAIETGIARVPSGMTPRQAAFGGAEGNSVTKPSLAPPASI